MSKHLKIAVRDFAVPLKKTGDLHTDLGSEFGMDLGIQIHQDIQSKLQEENDTYEAEVSIKSGFSFDELTIELLGRIDGLYRSPDILLEEIKSTHRFHDLVDEIYENAMHPYRLQLLTYGLLYESCHQSYPKLKLRLVCSKTRREKMIDILIDDAAKIWFQDRLEQIVDLFKEMEELKSKREKIAESLTFPFERKRNGQEELIQFVESHIQKGSQLLLQAPTGLGKTAGVMFPSMMKAFSQGRALIFSAPKNSLFKNAIDFLKLMSFPQGSPKILVLTAKSKACLQSEVDCRSDICPYSFDYYSKRNKIQEGSVFIDRDYCETVGLDYEICPYELAQEQIYTADIIICDYNYIISNKNTVIERLNNFIIPLPKPILVFDEVHNLYERSIDGLSPSIPVHTIAEYLETSSDQLTKKEEDVFERTNNWLGQYCQKEHRLINDIPEKELNQLSQELNQCVMTRFQSSEPLSLSHPLIWLYFLWNDWMEAYALSEIYDELVVVGKQERDQKTLSIVCLDPSFYLSEQWKKYHAIVGFSATVKPFDFYSRMSGFSKRYLKVGEFASPFPKTNRKILIVPQVETTYKKRHLHYDRVVEVISRLVKIKPGHYLVFFPSYFYLKNIVERLQSSKLDMDILTQEQGASVKDIEDIKDTIRKQTQDGTKYLLCCVQGGQLSEGVDFKGYGFFGAFVVGPAIPAFSFERRIKERFYEQKYKQGQNYAYTYPAMTRSVQSAGRVVRTESERAIVVLLDSRFKSQSFRATFPDDWGGDQQGSLISTSIIQDIGEFWSHDPSSEL